MKRLVKKEPKKKKKIDNEVYSEENLKRKSINELKEIANWEELRIAVH